MRVLAINGSPTCKECSITELVLAHLLTGARTAGAEVCVIRLAEKKLLPCDCGHRFACWTETPGKCIHQSEDDVNTILDAMIKTDLIILATPLYVESMTGQMKMLLDRTLPLVLPFIEVGDGISRHPLRSMMPGKRFALVSVCGHYEMVHFDALVKTFEQLVWNLHGICVGTILRPHAMLLRTPERIGDVYDVVIDALREAGRQMVTEGCVRDETDAMISSQLVTKDAFVDGANRTWRESLDRRGFR